MQIEKLDEEFQFMGSGLDRSSAHDTGLIHLSDVAKYIDLKMQFTKAAKGTGSWNLPAAAEAGFSWED